MKKSLILLGVVFFPALSRAEHNNTDVNDHILPNTYVLDKTFCGDKEVKSKRNRLLTLTHDQFFLLTDGDDGQAKEYGDFSNRTDEGLKGTMNMQAHGESGVVDGYLFK